MVKVRVVLCSTKVLQLSSSFVQAGMPWMAAPSNEKREETAVCALRGLEIVRDGAGLAKLVRDGQWRHRAVLSCARRRRAVKDYVQRCTRGVSGDFAWAYSALCKCVLYRK
jgi:hypothetical protein